MCSVSHPWKQKERCDDIYFMGDPCRPDYYLACKYLGENFENCSANTYIEGRYLLSYYLKEEHIVVQSAILDSWKDHLSAMRKKLNWFSNIDSTCLYRVFFEADLSAWENVQFCLTANENHCVAWVSFSHISDEDFRLTQCPLWCASGIAASPTLCLLSGTFSHVNRISSYLFSQNKIFRSPLALSKFQTTLNRTFASLSSSSQHGVALCMQVGRNEVWRHRDDARSLDLVWLFYFCRVSWRSIAVQSAFGENTIRPKCDCR